LMPVSVILVPLVSKFGISLQEWHHWCQLFSRSFYIVYLSSLMPGAPKLHCFRETIFQNRLVLRHRVLLVPPVPTGFRPGGQHRSFGFLVYTTL
jgi:hypothetical protein